MSYKVTAICMKVMLLAVFMQFLQLASAQTDWSKLDAAISEKTKILGDNLVAMIWNPDSLVYKKEVGTFNSKTQAPIASCSKWLTAALVMQFVDEGKLSLDDKVTKYIPEFAKYFKGYITIRNCLSHMTGIADEDKFVKKILERRKFASLEEEVNAFAARDIRANPGTDFWYGNVGLNIAGRVLEVISKKKFESLIKSKLFVPLGMLKSTFSELSGAPVNPSGGAKSTADDYMKFLVMLLNKGKLNGVQVLTEKSVEIMLKAHNSVGQVKYAPKSAEGFTYASGSWVLEEKIIKNNPEKVSTVVASPGLFGTWPMIDYCRGYAYIVFVKNYLGEEKADVHLQLKAIVDSRIKDQCE